MIEVVETIVQDQLYPSRVPGKVCAHYPRGAATILCVLFTKHPVELQAIPADQESGFTTFSVTGNGNLLCLPDRANEPAYVIPGADLHAL